MVILAGLAEIAAGSIAMGLGGYLAARTDSEHYESELQREYEETRRIPEQETAEVAEVFEAWGLTGEQTAPIVAAICANEKRWVDFMMRFELGLEKPDPGRALRSAATIAVSYIAGGFIPLAPYFLVARVSTGLAGLGRGYADRAAGLRMHQSALHGDSDVAGRAADHVHRGTGRRPRRFRSRDFFGNSI